jgi:hypothetical protein
MRRECGGSQLFLQQARVAVIYRSPPFRVHDAAFGLDELRIERQIADAIGLHVHHEFERGGREEVGINGDILTGVGVVASACFLHLDIELFRSVLLRAVKHHVLEKV